MKTNGGISKELPLRAGFASTRPSNAKQSLATVPVTHTVIAKMFILLNCIDRLRESYIPISHNTIVLVYRISDQLLYVQEYIINGKRARVSMLRFMTPTDLEVKPTQFKTT